MTQDRTAAAFGLILIFAMIIGFTDNFVQTIAQNHGLWQFHATRSGMALALVTLAVLVLGLRAWPRSFRGVAARSAIHGAAMVIYFGALAFLPVAIVAAGLFTAPIFVLLIERFVYGRPIPPVSVVAVVLGFVGVVLVLGPSALEGATLAAVLPVAAGMMYAMGNIATREWCAGESALTLTAGFFAALGIIGCAGMLVLSVLPLPVPAGPDGFIPRGWVWPDATFLFWTFVQSVGSLVGVAFGVRAYQLARANRVAVMEYVILPASAFWTWALWGEMPTLSAVAGMALIIAAGVLIALSAPRPVEAVA
jgi:drug/metabolite transporter (DMT)-like permease